MRHIMALKIGIPSGSRHTSSPSRIASASSFATAARTPSLTAGGECMSVARDERHFPALRVGHAAEAVEFDFGDQVGMRCQFIDEHWRCRSDSRKDNWQIK